LNLRNGGLLDKTPSSVKKQRALFHVKQAPTASKKGREAIATDR
jgi:hypothetical protein